MKIKQKYLTNEEHEKWQSLTQERDRLKELSTNIHNQLEQIAESVVLRLMRQTTWKIDIGDSNTLQPADTDVSHAIASFVHNLHPSLNWHDNFYIQVNDMYLVGFLDDGEFKLSLDHAFDTSTIDFSKLLHLNIDINDLALKALTENKNNVKSQIDKLSEKMKKIEEKIANLTKAE